MFKTELRRKMRELNRSLVPDVRAAASERLFRRVETLPAFAGARTVALFCSLGDEPDTAPVLACWGLRKRLAVPRVEGDEMRFYWYDPATLCAGAFGIAEPGPGAVRCDPAQIDLVVVPGVAFTRGGDRLGRGRGYYDRYLSQPEMHAVKVGVCYAHQLVDCLPAEPHDVTMDCVISE